MNKALASALGLLRGVFRTALTWLSKPLHAILAALALAFLVSSLSLALADRYVEAVLFFPSRRTGAPVGELRDLPRPRGAEAKAELLVSEILLGPASSRLSPAFAQDSRLESAIYRKGRLYIDISADAALAGASELKTGLKALERSLRLGFPWLKELKVTIGGREPYAAGIEPGK
jgi:hypothetical protein